MASLVAAAALAGAGVALAERTARTSIRPVGPEGDTQNTAWQSRPALTESALVKPAYEAAQEYNEVGISPVLPG